MQPVTHSELSELRKCFSFLDTGPFSCIYVILFYIVYIYFDLPFVFVGHKVKENCEN